jgi:uncharacterized membrane protein
MQDPTTIIVAMILVLAYICPTALAHKRKHPQLFAIAAVNILFGWTVIGWVIALAWATKEQKREVEQDGVSATVFKGSVSIPKKDFNDANSLNLDLKDGDAVSISVSNGKVEVYHHKGNAA